jgi:hypothetical protein
MDLGFTRRLEKGTPLTAEDYDSNLDKVEAALTEVDDSLSQLNADAVKSVVTGIAGADRVLNIVSLTQAEYDEIVAPVATTLYVVTD